MDQKQRDGVLRTSLGLLRAALREDAFLRQSLLVTILSSALASISCAEFGLSLPLGGDKGQAITPALFHFLYVPQQLLLMDRLLGHAAPRAGWRQAYLDARLLRMLWVWLKFLLAFALPCAAVVLLIALLGGLLGQVLSKVALGLALFAVALALIPAGFYLFTRLLYLPVLVAQGRPRELRTALAETRRRFWAILRSVAAAYTLVFVVATPVSLAAEWLAGHAPLWGLAAGFLLDALVVGLANGLSAVVLAESYRRVVLEGGAGPADFLLEPERPAD